VTVRVKLFAVLRDLAGLSELALELPPGATVAQATEPLLQRLPSLHEHLHRCRFAVNLNYAHANDTLHDGDELALIPPVSGG
jgi:sulfur-carrier protein